MGVERGGVAVLVEVVAVGAGGDGADGVDGDGATGEVLDLFPGMRGHGPEEFEVFAVGEGVFERGFVVVQSSCGCGDRNFIQFDCRADLTGGEDVLQVGSEAVAEVEHGGRLGVLIEPAGFLHARNKRELMLGATAAERTGNTNDVAGPGSISPDRFPLLDISV